MIDAGVIVMLLGAFALGIGPVERAFATRRWVQIEIITPVFRSAFPLSPPRQDLERLVITAEASVESAKLRRALSRRAIRSRRRH